MDLREDPNFTPNESNDKLETGTAQGTSSTTMKIRSTQELNSGRRARVWYQSSMIEAQQNIIRKYQLQGMCAACFTRYWAFGFVDLKMT
jgi:hypothetical protein